MNCDWSAKWRNYLNRTGYVEYSVSLSINQSIIFVHQMTARVKKSHSLYGHGMKKHAHTTTYIHAVLAVCCGAVCVQLSCPPPCIGPLDRKSESEVIMGGKQIPKHGTCIPTVPENIGVPSIGMRSTATFLQSCRCRTQWRQHRQRAFHMMMANRSRLATPCGTC